MAVLLNPVDPAFLDDPYPVYARLRREAPVYRHPGGFFALARHADVTAALREPGAFSSAVMGGPRPMVGPTGEVSPTSGSLIAQDPPVHTRQRAIVNRAFTPRRIASLEPTVSKLVDELFAGFEGSGACELMEALANPLPVSVIAELLGLPAERRDDFKRWSNSLIVGSTRGVGLDRARQLEEAREFQRYMTAYVEERRRDPGDDLVSALIHAEEEDEILEPLQVVSFATLLLAAGSETTTNLIGNATLALLAHPDALACVRDDPGRVPDVIEETLRWDPPIQMTMRAATRDVEVRDVAIPAGYFVMALLASANRDEDAFASPDAFDLDRDTAGHVAFGFGNHFCLGASLARLEARIALTAILERLPDLRLAADRIERHQSFLVRGPAALPLRFG